MAQMKSTKNYVYLVVVNVAWKERYEVDFRAKGVFTNYAAAVEAVKKAYVGMEDVLKYKIKNSIHKMYFDREYDESVGSYTE